MTAPALSPAPKLPRGARRPAEVFDRDGHPVLITMICPHCRETKPLRAFGLRRMANGTIRNAPWCKACRSKPGVPVLIVVREDPKPAGGAP